MAQRSATAARRGAPTWLKRVRAAGLVAVIAAGAGVVIVLAGQLLEAGRSRATTIGAAITLALVVGADRVFLGVHNPSDVIAGYLVGTVVVLTTLSLVSRRTKRSWVAPTVPDTIRA